MFRQLLTILSFVIFMLIVSCSDSSTEPEDSGNTVTDIDGNVYQTVKIGDQVWMAENLKVTHYRNGKQIPNVINDSLWTELSTGACCAFNNDNIYVQTYGLLYNWYAVNDSRNIAPEGWHVPTDEEWQTLIDSLGGNSLAGGKMKETGTTHWNEPNTGATNESGFTALPAGYRSCSTGTFGLLNSSVYWWASDEFRDYAWRRFLGYQYSEINRSYGIERFGHSVRLIKD